LNTKIMFGNGAKTNKLSLNPTKSNYLVITPKFKKNLLKFL